MSEPFILIDGPSDPERCNSLERHNTAQCRYKRIPGTTKCPRHAYNNDTQAKTEQTLKNYRLQKWQSRVIELVNSDGLKSLREEIGIIRMLLEEIVNQCQNATQLLIYSDQIHRCVMSIQSLVVSCQKLEERNGLLLDKTAVISLADQMVRIVSEQIDDPEKLATIGEKFAETIMKTASLAQQIDEALGK